MGHPRLRHHAGAAGVVGRQEVEGVFVEADLHVLHHQVEDALRIGGQVRREGAVGNPQEHP